MPAAGTQVASMPAWLPIQTSRTPSPSRVWSALARAKPAAVCPPVPPPARTTVRGRDEETLSRRLGALGSRTRPGPVGRAGLQPPFPRVALEGQLDQPVDQLRIRQSRRLPEARIGRETSEPGNRVDLVDPDARLALEEEV